MRKFNHLLFLWPLLLAGVCSSCSESPENELVENIEGRIIYVLNEGGFQKGNASIDAYNPESKQIQSGRFFQKNNRPLGDVLQSVQNWNNQLCWVVNNSGKIEITDAKLGSVATITGMTSPRYMAILSNKAYVTDLFSNYIWVVDLSAASIIDSIAVSGWTEGIATDNAGQVWFTRPSSAFIYKIDPSSNGITDSIEVSAGAYELVKDEAGNFWVLCSGNSTNSIKPALCSVNPSTKEVGWRSDFDGEYPSKLRFNAGNVYFLMGGKVYVKKDAGNKLEMLSEEISSAYGLGIDPMTKEIYVSDAKDFNMASEVHVYNAAGQLKNSFSTGVATNGFLFE